MRKIYSLVVLIAALLTSSVAVTAANITLKTPDPTKVKVEKREYYGSAPTLLEWTSGDLQVELSQGSIDITPVDGYQFVATSGRQNDYKWPAYSDLPGEGETQSIGYYSVSEGDVFYFETEVYTPKQITLKADDYTHVSVSNAGSDLELTSNETVISKPKGTYARLTVNAADEYLLSSVKVGDVEKLSSPNVESWDVYWSDLEANAVVNVTTVERPAKILNIKADPQYVIVKYLDAEVEATDVNGIKTFVVPSVAKNKSVEIYAKEGYALEGLRNEGRTDDEYMMAGAVYTNISEYGLKYGDNNYSVGAYDKESRRTAKFKITVDQPENLYIKRSADFKAMTGKPRVG